MKTDDNSYSKSLFISEREKLILELIVKEYSTIKIAKELHLSVNTIKVYRSRIMSKLGVKNVAGLVREAIVRRLFSKDFSVT